MAPKVIACLSGLFTPRPGDPMFSSTRTGIAAVKSGDVMRGHVEGVGDIEVPIV
jgi:fumarylpyruvate hydrolase